MNIMNTKIIASRITPSEAKALASKFDCSLEIIQSDGYIFRASGPNVGDWVSKFMDELENLGGFVNYFNRNVQRP